MIKKITSKSQEKISRFPNWKPYAMNTEDKYRKYPIFNDLVSCRKELKGENFGRTKKSQSGKETRYEGST